MCLLHDSLYNMFVFVFYFKCCLTCNISLRSMEVLFHASKLLKCCEWFGIWLLHVVACVGIGRRREGGRGGGDKKKTCWHRLSDSQQISTIYRIAASNPKLSLTAPVGQGIYIETAGFFLSVFGLQRELVRCWCWGVKSFISYLLFSPSHLFLPPFTPVTYWTRWMAAVLCEPAWIFFFSSSTLSFSAFEP